MNVQNDLLLLSSRIIIFAIITVVFCCLAFVFYDTIKRYLKKKMYLFKRWLEKFKEKMWLMKRVWRELKYNYNSHSIEIIFQLFIHFYETNKENINEGWEFGPGDFTKADLSYLYQWIIDIRPRNFNKAKNLDYDFMKKCFFFWGVAYKGLKYKITDEGELKLIPLEALVNEHPERVFDSQITKIQNDLFALDTEKAKWIIDRRKYLKI